MKSRRALVAAALCGPLSCLTVPPEQPPPDTPRKATAVVDQRGRRIEGGNLIIDIPADALREDERITLTIDEILGAPARHLKDAYLVGPADQAFDLPVEVSYRYQERWVEDVVDLDALFVGVARGQEWEPLQDRTHDASAKIFRGKVMHFSTFGLIDPNAPVLTDAGTARDVARRDSAGVDLVGRDSNPIDAGTTDRHADDVAGAPLDLSIQLVWDHPTADLDLHLVRSAGAPFSDDDCYYQNCKAVGGLDWPPSGAAGNPWMDIDDTNGIGPENIVAETLADGTYVIAVHYYSPNSSTVALTYTVRAFSRGEQILSQSFDFTACNQFNNAADLTVSQGGAAVHAVARSDSPFMDTHGYCN